MGRKGWEDARGYLAALTEKLLGRFSERLLYVGLQGSYLRGEATEESDLDVMAVLDELTTADMAAYREITESLPHPERACGFLCGREELARWNPLEICHLLHTTRDWYGELAPLVPPWTEEDVRNYVKLSAGNLYHELCHRYVHGAQENTVKALPGLYKASFFVLQNLYFLRTGVFASTKAELLSLLTGGDRLVLSRALAIKQDGPRYPEDFSLLFDWCRDTLRTL